MEVSNETSDIGKYIPDVWSINVSAAGSFIMRIVYPGYLLQFVYFACEYAF